MAGLYLHIPFCHSKCSYCDFYSMPQNRYMKEYINALSQEWRLRRHEIHEPLSTVYIGGGTPSIVPAAMLGRLIESIGQHDITEFTVEANPEDITPEWVNDMRLIGVNRMSIGIQSFVDEELKAINRRHSAAEAETALCTLHDCGITNISGDLIYGLPGQTPSSWQTSLDRLLAAGVTHVSAYSLTYEPGTRLHAMLSTGKIREADEDTVEEMYTRLITTLRDKGFQHYEISNFALPGMEARHNSSYWKFTPYLGLGTAAHSFDGERRRVNNRGIKRYISTISSGSTFYETEEETPDELYNDYIITSLRTSAGIDKLDFTSRFGDDALAALLLSARPYLASGMMTDTGGRLAITEKSFLVSDSILVALIR